MLERMEKAYKEIQVIVLYLGLCSQIEFEIDNLKLKLNQLCYCPVSRTVFTYSYREGHQKL